MKKKILSLLLSLAMIMTLTANLTMVSAENEDFTMSVKYYSDPDNLEGSEITSVNVGDIFYVGVSIQGNKRVKLIETSFGYDPSKMCLVSYADDANELVIPDEGIVGNTNSGYENNFGEGLEKAELYGVRFFDIDSRVKIESNARRPKIEKKSKRYVSDTEIKNEPSVIISFNHGKGTSSGNISSEKILVLLKFKAKDGGQGVFTFPRVVSDQDGNYAEDDYYEVSIKDGVAIFDEDYAIVGKNLRINNEPINIVENIPQLMPPENVQISGREIMWEPVGLGPVSSYRVKIEANDSNADGTYYIDTTETYVTIPEEILYGSLEFTIEAISGDPLNYVSSVPSNPIFAYIEAYLAPPEEIIWYDEDNLIEWEAVPYATQYRIQLLKDGILINDFYTPNTQIDISSYIYGPGEYRLKLSAISDFAESDTIEIRKTIQEGYKIRGYAMLEGFDAMRPIVQVYQEDNSGIVVTVEELGISSVTDVNGEYTLYNIPSGNYTLLFEHPTRPFLAKKVSVTVENDDADTDDTYLYYGELRYSMGSSYINAMDLSLLIGVLYDSSKYNYDYDIDGDGEIGIPELQALVRNLGRGM